MILLLCIMPDGDITLYTYWDELINEVYVAGHENGMAKYWKDGVENTTFTGGSNGDYTYSIFVYENEVYIAGYEWNSTTQGGIPKY